MPLVLVDTSSWVEALRSNGRPEIRRRIFDLIDRDVAAWCDPVRLELWNSRSAKEQAKKIRELEAYLPSLEITPDVWSRGHELARRARAEGLTCPTIDILIAACASHHRAEIESCDKHFERLAAIK
jgi:predicted nucleic acid-binding protein